MARLPYTNFHDMNLDWVLKQIKTAYTRDNPPPYPVKSVNGQTGNVTVTGDTIPIAPNNPEKVTDVLREKQDAPASPGTPGQVLGLGPNQTPVWINQTGGVTSYDELTGKPSVNGVILSGEMEGTDLGLIDAPSVPGTAGQVLTSDGQGGQSWQTPVTPPAPGAGDYAPVIMDSASGPVASFPDGADGLYMPSLVAEIVPVQAGTGDPSPSNVRAISGRGGLTVYHTGANVWDEETETGSLSTIDGSEIVNVNTIRTKNYIPVVPNATYMFVTSDQLWVVFFDNNKNIITSGLPSGATYSNNARNFRNGWSCLMPADCAYVRWYFRSEYGTTYKNDTGLNYPSTVAVYNNYRGDEPILYAWGDIAGNIYGGTLDVLSGVLTVDWNLVTLDGTESYQNYTNVVVCNKTFPVGYAQNAKYIISSAEKYPNIQFAVQNNRNTFQFNKTAFGVADEVELKALFAQLYASNTPVTIAYKLETPINTYQLTPQQVQTILGQNNIYSDSGDCSVTYRADTKLFILKVIA